MAWIKISLALSRGRFSVVFLVLLWLLACAAVGFVHLWPRQTVDGETALSALQELFPYQSPLSILPRETPDELDMLAAVHGVADVPSRRIARRKDDARHDHRLGLRHIHVQLRQRRRERRRKPRRRRWLWRRMVRWLWKLTKTASD